MKQIIWGDKTGFVVSWFVVQISDENINFVVLNAFEKLERILEFKNRIYCGRFCILGRSFLDFLVFLNEKKFINKND